MSKQIPFEAQPLSTQPDGSSTCTRLLSGHLVLKTTLVQMQFPRQTSYLAPISWLRGVQVLSQADYNLVFLGLTRENDKVDESQFDIQQPRQLFARIHTRLFYQVNGTGNGHSLRKFSLLICPSLLLCPFLLVKSDLHQNFDNTDQQISTTLQQAQYTYIPSLPLRISQISNFRYPQAPAIHTKFNTRNQNVSKQPHLLLELRGVRREHSHPM